MNILSLKRVSNSFGNFRFIQCTIGDSDVMSLSLYDNGDVRFSRSPGLISRPEGKSFKAMLLKVREVA